jgi:outer membrane protein assembly factor BamB
LLAATASGALSACALHQALVACGTDRDCKLDRVCDSGRCVWPGTPRPRPIAPPPAYASTTAAARTASRGEPPPPPAPGAMFRYGPDHRGRSPYRAPLKRPDVIWSYETRAPITSTPVITSDGAVAVGSHDGQLHVVGKDGKPLWRFATGDLVFSSPALAAGAIAYIGSDDDHLYALDLAARRVVWRFQIGACPQSVGVGPEASRCDVDAGPTLGRDGIIYTGGDAVYAINPDGTLRWRFPTGGHVSAAPAVLPDGTAIAGSQDNLVYAIAPDGTKRWDFRAGGDVESSPAVGDDGTIYFGSDDEKVYALSANGQLIWAFNAGGSDGLIYVGAFDNRMYAIRRDGTLAWTFRTGDRILSSATVDGAGTILFGSQDDRLYALDPNGQLRWSVALGGDVDSSPVLAADGTIYVGSDDGKLYALKGR